MSPSTGVEGLAPWQFDMYVGAEADGDATPEQLAVLEADPIPWRAALVALLRDAEEHLASARSLPGEERDQVIADLESERRRLAAAYARLTHDPSVEERDTARASEPGRKRRAARADREPEPEPVEAGTTELQVSWEPGRVVAWAGGSARAGRRRATRSPRCSPPRARRQPVGAGTRSVPLPGGRHGRRAGDPGRRGARLARRRGRRPGRRRHRRERALVGPGRDLGGRAHRARRDGAVAPPAHAAQRRARASRTARTRCAGRRRSSMPRA